VSDYEPWKPDPLSEPWRAALDEVWLKYCTDHYPNGVCAVFGFSKNGQISLTACIEGHTYQPKNYCNGKWRSVWSVVFEGSGSRAELKGVIKAQVHYYEDGNVQFFSSKDIQKQITISNEKQTAEEMRRLVEEAESEYQTAVSDNYRTMSETTFKALRRALPVIQQKLDWNRLTVRPFVSQSCAQLRHNFSTSASRQRVENVLIIGGGLMGSGIAQSCATSGKFNTITLQDVNQKQLEISRKGIESSVQKLHSKKLINIESVDKAVNSIHFTQKIEPKADKNLLIVEAIPELLDAKQKIFANLSQQFKGNDSVIFVTNTSSLSVQEIGVNVEAQERYGGLHFFNPVPLMRLVEIIKNVTTSQQTVDALKEFVADIQKVSVLCKDTPGFIVNRLLIPYSGEAVKMVERGDASFQDVDTAMKLGAGYPMGPFELMDMTGLDTGKFITDAWAKRKDSSLPEMTESKLVNKLVSEGRLGRKSGKGCVFGLILILVFIYETNCGSNETTIKGCEGKVCSDGKRCVCQNPCPPTCRNPKPNPCNTFWCNPNCYLVCDGREVLDEKTGRCKPLNEC
ncbi:unnamed protein product, partial [Oppiella nova]